MTYHPDLVEYSTLTEAYISYSAVSIPLHIFADVLPNGFTDTAYSVTIPYARNNTRADLYVSNGTNKALLTAGSRFSTFQGVYTFTNTESVSKTVTYSSNSITIALAIFNGTGGSITLVPQDLTFTAVLYDAPF